MNVLALALVAMNLAACSMPARSSEGVPSLVVALGDRLEDVNRRSAVEVRTGDGQIEGHVAPVAAPFDFHFLYGGQELVLRHSNGAPDRASLQFGTGDGRLIGIALSPIPEPATLEEAIATAQQLRSWFLARGFRASAPPEGEAPSVARIVQSVEPAAISMNDAEAVRRAWADDRVRVSEMTLFSLESPEVMAGLELVNLRRKREYAGLQVEDGNPLTERRYSLILNIFAK